MSIPSFSVVPLDVIRDRRLSLEQTRVLIALIAFADKKTGECFPSRDALAEASGYKANKISTITTDLAKLGWIEKRGSGGRSSPSIYRILKPKTVSHSETVSEEETVSHSETVSEEETVSHSETKTVSHSETKTVSHSERGKEQTIEQTREQTKRKTTQKESDIDRLEREGVEKQIAVDYLAIRKAKRAPLTETALSGLKREAAKAGMSLNEALTECCNRNWLGFKADWLDNNARAGPKPKLAFVNRQVALEQSNAIECENWIPPELRTAR
jgi:hypothetical protein